MCASQETIEEKRVSIVNKASEGRDDDVRDIQYRMRAKVWEPWRSSECLEQNSTVQKSNTYMYTVATKMKTVVLSWVRSFSPSLLYRHTQDVNSLPSQPFVHLLHWHLAVTTVGPPTTTSTLTHLSLIFSTRIFRTDCQPMTSSLPLTVHSKRIANIAHLVLFSFLMGLRSIN